LAIADSSRLWVWRSVDAHQGDLSFRNMLRRRDAEAQADQQADAEAKKKPAVELSND
jgi:hypothetical protein